MNLAKKILLLTALSSFSALDSFGQMWTPTGSSSNQWSCLASSADGEKLIAAVGNSGALAGELFYSTNAGVSWTHTTNGISPQFFFTAIASSADGSKLFATDGSSDYASTNSGGTWKNLNAGISSPVAVASSADGQKLAMVAAGQTRVYTSTNSGATWTNTLFVPLVEKVIASADGGTIIAWRNIGNGSIYVSTNSGTTWSTNELDSYLNTVASSADGKKLFGVGMVGNVFISTNSGSKWITNKLTTSFLAYAAASADGKRFIAMPFSTGTRTGYISTDSGVTWNSINVISNQSWGQVIYSADAGELFATPSSGFVETFQFTSSPQISLSPTNNNLKLSWIIPSTNFILQSSADLSSWTDLTNQPVLNLTNLQNEVYLSPTGNIFYRLKTP